MERPSTRVLCPCMATKKPFVHPRSRSLECPRGPTAMKKGLGGNAGNCVTKRRYREAYSCGVMSPPQPQDSFPTPQKRTPKGSLEPFMARRSEEHTSEL